MRLRWVALHARRALFSVVAFSVVFVPRRTSAQVRWDVGAEAGVLQRFTTAADRTAKAPAPGPSGEIHAHVAIVPMLRGGPYVAFDLSPLLASDAGPSGGARQFIEAGVRAKLTPPLLRDPWRVWAFAGIGYARGYAPSHTVSAAAGAAAMAGMPLEYRVGGAGGGLLDIPFGVGLGARVRRPWMVFAELGVRVGVAFVGSLYDRPQCGCVDPYIGKDSAAVGLSLGVSLEQ